jgi:hypothetical protein
VGKRIVPKLYKKVSGMVQIHPGTVILLSLHQKRALIIHVRNLFLTVEQIELIDI